MMSCLQKLQNWKHSYLINIENEDLDFIINYDIKYRMGCAEELEEE